MNGKQAKWNRKYANRSQVAEFLPNGIVLDGRSFTEEQADLYRIKRAKKREQHNRKIALFRILGAVMDVWEHILDYMELSEGFYDNIPRRLGLLASTCSQMNAILKTVYSRRRKPPPFKSPVQGWTWPYVIF